MTELGLIDNEEALLHALFQLHSPDVVSVAATCRALRALLTTHGVSGDNVTCGGPALSFWRRLSPSKAGVGIHRQGCIWLHGVAEFPLIESYVRRVQRATVLRQVNFCGRAEVASLVSALDQCKTKYGFDRGDGNLFIGEWRFKADDVMTSWRPTAHGGQLLSSIKSSPLHFCWMFQQQLLLRFSLHLTLCPSGDSSDQLALSWEPRFVGETTVEERDVIEISLAGAAVLPVASDDGWQAQAVRPWLGGLDGEFGHSPAPVGSVPAGPVCDALLQGASLRCAVRVLLCSMGAEQHVSPWPVAQPYERCSSSPILAAAAPPSAIPTIRSVRTPGEAEDSPDEEEVEAAYLLAAVGGRGWPSVLDDSW